MDSEAKNRAKKELTAIAVIVIIGVVVYYGASEAYSAKLTRVGKYAELAKSNPHGSEFLGYINKAFDKLANPDTGNDVSAYLDIGFYENELGDKDGAIAAYKAGIKADPKNELIMSNLAHIYEEQKDYASAESYYKQIIGLNPKNVRAILDLGNLYKSYFKDRQSDIADVVGIKGLAANPNDLNLLGFLADFYGSRHDETFKNLQKAEADYKRILELDPKNEAVKAEMNALLKQEGRVPVQ